MWSGRGKVDKIVATNFKLGLLINEIAVLTYGSSEGIV